MSITRISEGVLILTAAVALAAPFQAAIGTRQQFWYVAQWAFQRPLADLRGMQTFVLGVRGSTAGNNDGRRKNMKECVSQGIAALIPNAIRPDEILDPEGDVGQCRVLVLMQGEMNYEQLKTRAEAQRFTRAVSKDNAELWLATNAR
jgi:hypothetical protein